MDLTAQNDKKNNSLDKLGKSYFGQKITKNCKKIQNKIFVFMELNLDFNIKNERFVLHQFVFNSLIHNNVKIVIFDYFYLFFNHF